MRAVAIAPAGRNDEVGWIEAFAGLGTLAVIPLPVGAIVVSSPSRTTPVNALHEGSSCSTGNATNTWTPPCVQMAGESA